eukprot:1871205-Pleurochrysis_carterae.AAC.1
MRRARSKITAGRYNHKQPSYSCAPVSHEDDNCASRVGFIRVHQSLPGQCPVGQRGAGVLKVGSCEWARAAAGAFKSIR